MQNESRLSVHLDGTIGTISKETLLKKPTPKGLVKSKDHLTFLQTILQLSDASTGDAIELSAEEGIWEQATFTEVSRGLDHLLWLIEAHLQG